MTEPIRVGVNLLWCVPGQVGGSEEYLVRQLTGLAPQRQDLAPTIHCLPSFDRAHPELRAAYPVEVAPVEGTSRPLRVVAEHTWLAATTRHADVVHHGGGTTPTVGRRPIVLTIHDLQYLSLPQYFAPTKLRYLRTVVPRSVRRADIVAVPTDYVRRTVVEAFGADRERVVVVPHGVDVGDHHDVPAPGELRQRYRLGDGPVLVLPAITHPHKGHRFLLDVMASCWHEPDLRLVLLGGPGPADAAVAARIESLGLHERVVRPGRVPARDRDGLVALADALVFPSEYEGFGAPVVEAMALGTPVVCSDQPALAEVVGAAGLVRPRRIEAWSDVLAEVARRRAELVAAGHERAASFTTRISGAALAGAYRAAVAV